VRAPQPQQQYNTNTNNSQERRRYEQSQQRENLPEATLPRNNSLPSMNRSEQDLRKRPSQSSQQIPPQAKNNNVSNQQQQQQASPPPKSNTQQPSSPYAEQLENLQRQYLQRREREQNMNRESEEQSGSENRTDNLLKKSNRPVNFQPDQIQNEKKPQNLSNKDLPIAELKRSTSTSAEAAANTNGSMSETRSRSNGQNDLSKNQILKPNLPPTGKDAEPKSDENQQGNQRNRPDFSALQNDEIPISAFEFDSLSDLIDNI
jgi:hypothetical protein